jgi:PAS domain S-box-containing protein
MLRFTDMSINRKLTTVILATCTTVLLLAGIIMIATEFVTSRGAMAEHMTLRADLLGRFSTAPLSFHREEDVEEIKQILSALQSDAHLQAACVYDKSQRRFGEFVRDGQTSGFPPEPAADGYRFTRNSLEIFHPVFADQKRIGTIYLRSDLGRIYRQIGLYAGIVGVLLAVAIAAVSVTSPRLRRPIAEPIIALAEVAKHVAEKKDYAARAVKRSDDEIGLLTDAFNQMLSEIETVQYSLLKSNESMQTEITERIRAEEDLRKSEAQLQTVVENLDEGVVVADLFGQVLHFNRAALELHGFTSIEECRRHLTELAETFVLSTLDGTELPVHQWPLSRVLSGERLHDWEVRIRRIKGDWERIFSYGGTLVPDANGKPLMAVVTLSDVTERKRAAEEIRQLNMELEQRVVERTAQLQTANNELEAFSYSVSHDLRAPLRSLDGFSQALMEDSADVLNAEGQDNLRRIRAASQRMGQLIDDLLNLSRLTRVEMSKETVDLSKMARDTVEELRAADRQRTAEVVIADGLTANADPRLLQVVMTNLLGNAWKFSGKNPNPRIEFGYGGENGNKAFFVRDNGAGFDMAYANKLFGAFQRLHAMHEFPGTGIGLAIVKRVINRHGGKVWAESAPDQGATFRFTL